MDQKLTPNPHESYAKAANPKTVPRRELHLEVEELEERIAPAYFSSISMYRGVALEFSKI